MARYAFTLFTSAFLLFGVQPLVGRYALPWFGGTPAVWTTCMLFFQGALLAGYAYAHASATRLPPRRQVQLHLGLLVVAVGVLAGRALLTGSPVAPGPEWRSSGNEALLTGRLLAMLAVTLGLPFFVLSTTAPLLQSWFSRARPGVSPYRLYALSNAGSLLALLGYPFLIEPALSRSAQGLAWGGGFLIFTAGCAACAWDVWKRAEAPAPGQAPEQDGPGAAGDTQRPGAWHSLAWLGLSACASVLLLATTNQLSRDVAAGPFLWVLPLGLYLLTFILTFEREAFYRRAVWVPLLIVSVGGVLRALFEGPHWPLSFQLLAYGGALLAGCMVCHGELYRLRPAPRHLSAFYLQVSAGGALGGVFVGLVAPRVFDTYGEYPLALAACCLVALVPMLSSPANEGVLARLGRLARVFVLAAGVVGIGVSLLDIRREVRVTVRNFFGVVQVLELGVGDPERHLFSLKHGTTTHGFQLAEPSRRSRPTAYFTRDSGLGLAIAEQRRLREASGPAPALRIGVLGLGVGTSAALAGPADSVRFYEINPAVIALARGEGGYFSFLRDTRARVEVVQGDARISLERELERGEARGFDVLALDVFSSDAIPMHLLTREAVALYRAHLAPRGVLALHISSSHLDLLPVTLAHARDSGMHATLVITGTQGDTLRSAWVLLAPDADFSQGPTFTRTAARVYRQEELEGAPPILWTDEHHSVLPVLRREPRGRE
ncbi:fused MFS/spermidine synthase [Archangium gephyra]|uniref:spermidine synthase n=1 Tax=Archangium gephyra TaxID=48 RepID=UPI0035D51B0F